MLRGRRLVTISVLTFFVFSSFKIICLLQRYISHPKERYTRRMARWFCPCAKGDTCKNSHTIKLSWMTSSKKFRKVKVAHNAELDSKYTEFLKMWILPLYETIHSQKSVDCFLSKYFMPRKKEKEKGGIHGLGSFLWASVQGKWDVSTKKNRSVPFFLFFGGRGRRGVPWFTRKPTTLIIHALVWVIRGLIMLTLHNE